MLLKQNKMTEDKAKGSPDEAGGNDSKVFTLFCLTDKYYDLIR